MTSGPYSPRGTLEGQTATDRNDTPRGIPGGSSPGPPPLDTAYVYLRYDGRQLTAVDSADALAHFWSWPNWTRAISAPGRFGLHGGQLAEKLWCRFATTGQRHGAASLRRRRIAALQEALQRLGVIRPYNRIQEGWEHQQIEEWVLPEWFMAGRFRGVITETHGLRNWTQQQITFSCE